MSMKQIITDKVQQALNPSHLEVINESHMHRGPAGDSHYKLIVVSDRFEGERLIARHRRINGLLMEQLQGELHALALHTYTNQEWLDQSGAPRTPGCVS
ncbi:BolA/IbaG family iron-sulfur metabolism protein [uncultured Ferrimonas sp.]|uniref:BolA family protein n=1 Tax=uncultured Ferrimonas sp. TaxID=432640 RepID=UPI0026248826|nr:BolA/IbaG family iron-sulfur metabolism protein [uncultured Ferrimonas sp.]